MPTWTVQTRDKLHRRLTLYQLEALVGAGRVGVEDPAHRDDEASTAEWTQVGHIPALQQRLQRQVAPVQVLDDAWIGAMLRSDVDRRSSESMRRVATFLKVLAALIVAAELGIFAVALSR